MRDGKENTEEFFSWGNEFRARKITDSENSGDEEADTPPKFPELVHNSHDLNAASVAACKIMFLTVILYGFTLRKNVRGSKLQIYFTS